MNFLLNSLVFFFSFDTNNVIVLFNFRSFLCVQNGSVSMLTHSNLFEFDKKFYIISFFSLLYVSMYATYVCELDELTVK